MLKITEYAQRLIDDLDDLDFLDKIKVIKELFTNGILSKKDCFKLLFKRTK